MQLRVLSSSAENRIGFQAIDSHQGLKHEGAVLTEFGKPLPGQKSVDELARWRAVPGEVVLGGRSPRVFRDPLAKLPRLRLFSGRIQTFERDQHLSILDDRRKTRYEHTFAMFSQDDIEWAQWAAAMEDEHGSFPTIGRSQARKICDATSMRDVRVTCATIVVEEPTKTTGRVYSRECLDLMVEQSNALAARGAMFVTSGYPAYGNRDMTKIVGQAFDFEVYKDRVAATLRFIPTPVGIATLKIWDLVDGSFQFLPYFHAFVGAGNRVSAESLMLRGWYLDRVDSPT